MLCIRRATGGFWRLTSGHLLGYPGISPDCDWDNDPGDPGELSEAVVFKAEFLLGPNYDTHDGRGVKRMFHLLYHYIFVSFITSSFTGACGRKA